MRLGLGYLAEVFSIQEKVKYARLAERNDFASVWVAEHYFSRDAIVTASVLLSQTKRVRVGTSVINPYTRHPALLGMTSATLDEMSGGRFILGLGTGFPHWIEGQMGIQLGSPMTALFESFRIIRNMLDRSASELKGRRFIVHDVSLGFNMKSSRVPIYLAAVGPKMLKKAAQLADGVIMSGGSSTYYLRHAIPIIRDGLASSGKSRFDLVCLALLALSNDRWKARESLKPWVMMPLLRKGRAKQVLPDETVLAKSKAAWDSGDRRKAEREFPDEVMDAVSIAGGVEDCVAGVEMFEGLGLTELVLVPVSLQGGLLPKLMKRLAS